MRRMPPSFRTTIPASKCGKSHRRTRFLRTLWCHGIRRGHLRRQLPRDACRDACRASSRCLLQLGLGAQRRQTSLRQPRGGGEVDGHAAAGPVAVRRSRGGRSFGHAEAARPPGPGPRVGRSLRHAATATPAAPRWWQLWHTQPRRLGYDGSRRLSSLHRSGLLAEADGLSCFGDMFGTTSYYMSASGKLDRGWKRPSLWRLLA